MHDEHDCGRSCSPRHDPACACCGDEGPEWLEWFASPLSLALSAIALVLEALRLWGGVRFGGIHPAWIAVALSAPPSVVPGMTALVRRRKLTSELLVTLAIVASLVLGEVFAAAEVAFLMNLGEFLEERTARRSRRGLRALASVVPQSARRIRGDDGAEETVAAEEIRPGDRLRVRPGEAFPTDGTIAAGETSVDQSVLTGESLPVDKAVGDTVYCGTLNRQGSVEVAATSAAGESSLRKMIRLAEEADVGKARIQTTADRWAERLVPASLAVALLVFLAGGFLLGLPLREAALRGVTILVVFCPCALVLATPTALMAAIGHASRNGVIVKGGAALEALARATRIAFDKTGTLTEGRLRVADCSLASDDLALVAAVESLSEHPLAKAVCHFAGPPAGKAATSFRAMPGMGVEATVAGRRVRVGAPERLHVELPDAVAEAVGRARNDGRAVLVAEIDGRVAGHASMADVPRSGAREAIEALASLGMPAVLLSGDHAAAAAAVARACGIDDVRGDLLPQEKAAAIRALQAQGECVAMAGDGVNDALSLRTADIGIAMASLGCDAAVESADIALLGDDLSRLPYLRRLARATVRTITAGIALSMGINLVAVALSAAGLLGPVAGALVHNAGSVVVVSFAAFLYDRRIP